MYYVNKRGMQALKDWIEKTTKHDYFGPLCNTDLRSLNAWASEAEENAMNNNAPMVEMSKHHSRSGRPETFTLSADMVDWYDTTDGDIRPGLIGVMLSDDTRPPALWRCNRVFQNGTALFCKLSEDHHITGDFCDPIMSEVADFWPLIDADHAPR